MSDNPDDAGFGYWLARVLRTLRTSAEISLVEVAREAGKDQSSISRFERGKALPGDLDLFVNAYARACGIQHAPLLWAHALRAWGQAQGIKVTVSFSITDNEEPV